MTIKKAMELLAELAMRYGGDTEIITDCPHCGRETKPDTIVASPVRITIKEKET